MVRKLLIVGLCLLNIIISCSVIAQAGDDPEFLPNHLIVKFWDGSETAERLKVQSDQQRVSSVLNALALTESSQVVSIKPVFKLLEKDHALLKTVYDIEFTNEADLQSLLETFQANELIEYAEKIPRRDLLQNTHTPNDLQFSSQWYLSHINAEEAFWQFQNCLEPGFDLSEIVIAIIDDAIHTTHEDLSGSIWTNPDETSNGQDDDMNSLIDDLNGWDLGDNDNNVNPPTKGSCAVQNGHFEHGTHVAGIAAAITDNNTGIASFGGGMSILPIKCGRDNLSPHCGGALFNAYNGIEYAIIERADVINCSWGGKVYSHTEELIVNLAHSQGIVVVAAAGNEAQQSIYYPAAYSAVIAVGATDPNDEIASFSNYGDGIDVMAPGTNILSTLPQSTSSYGALQGTSMAAPLVSGLAAMIIALDPFLNPDEIKNILRSSCDDIYSVNNSKYAGKLGAGRINAREAIAMACPDLNNRVFRVSSNFQTVCPSQEVHFVARERRNLTVTNISWSFPGAGTITGDNTLTPTATYFFEGTYDVTFNYTDGYGNPQSTVLEDYITVEFNSTNYSAAVDNHWYMNETANIEINEGLVTTHTEIDDLWATEGVSSISNSDGNLLFYLHEGSLYNRLNEVMPSGSGLRGTSSTQSLIIPAPGTCRSEYFVFTMGNLNSTELFYSVVDMDADGGLGDVTVTETSIAQNVIINERITAYPHCNGTDMWVVFQDANSGEFQSFTINANPNPANALSLPAVRGTSVNTDYLGVMKASPNSEQLAVCFANSSIVEVYDVDRTSGAMSLYCSTNFSAFMGRVYNCEFSPNGEILYVANDAGQIFQIDLTSNTCGLTTVALSNANDQLWGLELGPDGRIYFSHGGWYSWPSGFNTDWRRFIGVINNPNVLGANSNIDEWAFEMDHEVYNTVLNDGVISRYINFQAEALSLPDQIVKCEGDEVTIQSQFQGVNASYQWFDDDGNAINGETGSSITVTTPGTYTLQVTDNGGCILSASVEVTDEVIQELFQGEIEIECGGSLTLDAGPGFASYYWSTGETSQSISITQPGIIFIKVTTENGCESVQEIEVESGCCRVQSNADPYEKEYYSDKYGIRTQGIISDPNGNLIIAGTSYDKTVQDGEPITDRGITLLSIDDKGDKNWIRRYDIADLYPSIFDPAVNVYDQIGLRVQDIRKGPAGFMITGTAFTLNTEWVSFTAIIDYSGNILTLKEYASPGENIMLNSINDHKDAAGVVDGYMVTGTRFGGAGFELLFIELSFSGNILTEKSVTYPGLGTTYLTGVESCPSILMPSGGSDGNIVAGIHGYSNGGTLDQSLILLKTDVWGNVTYTRRLSNAYHPGSDFKLLQTTSNAGQKCAYLFTYLTAQTGTTPNTINVLKLDENLNFLWLQEFESPGSSFFNVYDVVEEAGVYKVLGELANNKAFVFEIDQNGSPLSSNYIHTGVEVSGYHMGEDFHIRGYNDRYIMQGSNYVTAGIGANKGASIIKWDAGGNTTCTQEAAFTSQSTTISVNWVMSQTVVDANLNFSIKPPVEVDITTRRTCCDNGVITEIGTGCYFMPDFSYDVLCSPGRIVITDNFIFGSMGGNPTYEWTLDGNSVSTEELPEFAGLADGDYEVCLTVTYDVNCQKTVCKTITVGPVMLAEIVEACDNYYRFTPEDCETYYSYNIVGIYNSEAYGSGCAGWATHNLTPGNYTIEFKDANGCIKAILDLTVSHYVVDFETLTIETCDLPYSYLPDCSGFWSYSMTGQASGFPLAYSYNSLDNPSENAPGCPPGWIALDLEHGDYNYNFYDEDGCLQKVLELHIVPGTIYIFKDIELCQYGCFDIDITDPDFFCQPNNGTFFGHLDDGFQQYYIPNTTLYSLCPPFSGTYEFRTIHANGCTCIVTGNIIQRWDCIPEGPNETSVDDELANEAVINIYPNPTRDIVNVVYEGTIGQNATLAVTDLLGKELLSTNLSSNNVLDLSRIAKGTYLIRIENGSNTSYRRIVKE